MNSTDQVITISGHKSYGKFTLRKSDKILLPGKIFMSLVLLFLSIQLVFIWNTPIVFKLIGIIIGIIAPAISYVPYHLDYKRRMEEEYCLSDEAVWVNYRNKIMLKFKLDSIKQIIITDLKNNGNVGTIVFIKHPLKYLPAWMYSQSNGDLYPANVKFDFIELKPVLDFLQRKKLSHLIQYA